ncbi:hypothetical protein [Mycobacterium kubicae]|nr:hypothetical protein [Mycobacterium kubicae]
MTLVKTLLTARMCNPRRPRREGVGGDAIGYRSPAEQQADKN